MKCNLVSSTLLSFGSLSFRSLSYRSLAIGLLASFAFLAPPARADSVNSPNISLNVDTNRSVGNGAGNVPVTVNTITIAETMLSEYSSGTGKSILLRARPGYQFDSASNVTIQSTTIGFNGGAVNQVVSVTPTGVADEVLTFNLTSGTSTSVQDIARVNGVKIKILSAEGAAGPAKTTVGLTTSLAGGAFTNQGIVAANIVRGVADHLTFAVQPGDNQAGEDLLPEVKVVDFGGNLLTSETRPISLSISTNPGSATLAGNVEVEAVGGRAVWADSDDLRIATAAVGYELLASNGGSPLQSEDTVTSLPFEISAGNPGSLELTVQPTDTAAGDPIILSVRTVDEFGNPTATDGIAVTVDAALNGSWPLFTDTSTTKLTEDGVASWTTIDDLHIKKAVGDYQLSVSGLGMPVLTDLFTITPGDPALIRFVAQPSTTTEGVSFDPAVSVEVTDLFGNRTGAAVDLTAASSECSGTLTGDQATSVEGIATFDSLAFNERCDDASLLVSGEDLIGVTSDAFDVRASDESTMVVQSMRLKRGKVFAFRGQGTFTPSAATIDDPTRRGAVLTVTGTTGTIRYPLPKSGWRKLSPTSYVFSGARCQSVVVKRNSIRATCAGRTGSITLPESELTVSLLVGRGTQRFCGECGGTSQGDESRTFNRRNCEAPAFCS